MLRKFFLFLCVIALFHQPVFCSAVDTDGVRYYVITLDQGDDIDSETSGKISDTVLYVKNGMVYVACDAKNGDNRPCFDNNHKFCNGRNIGVPTMLGFNFLGYVDKYGNTKIELQGGDNNLCQDVEYDYETGYGYDNDMTLYADWSECAEDEVGYNQTSCKKITCSSDGYYIRNHRCIQCDTPSNLYRATTDESVSGYGIERCMAKLKTDSYGRACGDDTNVIYRRQVTNNVVTWVRDKNFTVVAGPRSVVKERFPDEGDFDNDYCLKCSEQGQFIIDGKCQMCNENGYCQASTGGNCIKIQAGYDYSKANIDNNYLYGNKRCPYTSAENYCPPNTYSYEGSAQCAECALGYTTKNSGPTSSGRDGLCLGVDENGFGYGCISAKACQKIPITLSLGCNIETVYNDEDKCATCGCNLPNCPNFMPRSICTKRKKEYLKFLIAEGGDVATCLCGATNISLEDKLKATKTWTDFVKTVRESAQD